MTKSIQIKVKTSKSNNSNNSNSNNSKNNNNHNNSVCSSDSECSTFATSSPPQSKPYALSKKNHIMPQQQPQSPPTLEEDASFASPIRKKNSFGGFSSRDRTSNEDSINSGPPRVLLSPKKEGNRGPLGRGPPRSASCSQTVKRQKSLDSSIFDETTVNSSPLLSYGSNNNHNKPKRTSISGRRLTPSRSSSARSSASRQSNPSAHSATHVVVELEEDDDSSSSCSSSSSLSEQEDIQVVMMVTESPEGASQLSIPGSSSASSTKKTDKKKVARHRSQPVLTKIMAQSLAETGSTTGTTSSASSGSFTPSKPSRSKSSDLVSVSEHEPMKQTSSLQSCHSDHTFKPLELPSASKGSKRGQLKRRNSVMFKNCQQKEQELLANLQAQQEALDEQEKKKRRQAQKIHQPCTLLSLLITKFHENPCHQTYRPYRRPLRAKSILKSTSLKNSSSHNSLYEYQPHQDDVPKNKHVRFATNPQSGQVWALTRTIEAMDASSYGIPKSILWWTDAELDSRFDQDTDMAALVEKEHYQAMRQAYESVVSLHKGAAGGTKPKVQKAQLDFELLSHCSLARGLELEAFPPLRTLKQRHRHAVLAAQELIRSEKEVASGAPTFAELKLMRLQSLKFSKAFRLVALEMAQFDQLEARG